MAQSESVKEIHPVHQYAQDVVTGKVNTNRKIRLACKRHLKDMKRAEEAGYYFDEDAANHAINFFTLFKHYKGSFAGETFFLEDWQMFVIGNMFGWKLPDGRRRFRQVYIFIPRKNGKSALIAILGLYLAFFDNEAGAEVYCAATKQEQARIVFEDAVNFLIRSHPEIKRRIKFRGKSYITEIYCDKTTSKFKPIASDSKKLDGLNPHAAIIDEYHAHQSKDLYGVLDTATGAREQPMLIVITTAGFNVNGPCYEMHNYALGILEETISDDSYFTFISSIDDGDDIFSPETWEKVNPNWGVSINPEKLEASARKAKHSRSELGEFLTKHLNVWSEGMDGFFDIDKYKSCLMDVDLDSLLGQRCFAGLDLAQRIDLTAFCLYFPDAKPFPVAIPFFWIPSSKLENYREMSMVPYERWVHEGHIFVTEGEVTNYDVVKDFIVECSKKFELVDVGIDPYNAAHITTQLMDEGIEVTRIKQSMLNFTPPMRELEADIMSESTRFHNNPVLTWMIANTITVQDGNGNVKPMKNKSRDKIDGVVALAMARACEIGQEKETPKKSIYETRDPIVL
ncbi:MAG: terminase large subunit [Alphaproteobacteria bacterium]|nr:terminase large subunit [Alphaproteobacteria bacterium]